MYECNNSLSFNRFIWRDIKKRELESIMVLSNIQAVRTKVESLPSKSQTHERYTLPSEPSKSQTPTKSKGKLIDDEVYYACDNNSVDGEPYTQLD